MLQAANKYYSIMCLHFAGLGIVLWNFSRNFALKFVLVWNRVVNLEAFDRMEVLNLTPFRPSVTTSCKPYITHDKWSFVIVSRCAVICSICPSSNSSASSTATWMSSLSVAKVCPASPPSWPQSTGSSPSGPLYIKVALPFYVNMIPVSKQVGIRLECF